MTKTALQCQTIDRSAVMRAAWFEWKKRVAFCAGGENLHTFGEYLRRAWFKAKLARDAAVIRAEREAEQAAHDAAFFAQQAAENMAIKADPRLAKRYEEASRNLGILLNSPEKYVSRADIDEAHAVIKSIRAEALAKAELNSILEAAE